MQWPVGSKECILVAGGNGEDDVANQLNGPSPVVVDRMGALSQKWAVLLLAEGVGGIGMDHLSFPEDLAFDRQGNIYVVDNDNHCVQMFAIDKSFCPKTMD
ncbi:unnamed protein product [Rotaria socialis]|uniref:NHL repeat-containing protein 2 n=1 Tax=Rotaria socialis TaxID=392032 RepID=A0A821NYD0_9BILA|nr:unnamed protein product [Rotaria socialis]